MWTLVHLSPVLLVMITLMVLRRPPVQAAIAGTVMVAVLWLAGAADTLQADTLVAASRDTTVLFLSTAFVIVPGMAFVILIERLGVNRVLSQWVQSLGLNRTQQIVFIVLGLAPLLEAMTGFGVSLIATVPLLLSLFERRAALRIALTGMAIMPWGTLGLATVIGASLAHLDTAALASTSALTSSLVFMTLGAVALTLAGAKGVRAFVALGIYSVLFVGVLYGASRLLGPEVAGISAGFTVALTLLLWALYRTHSEGGEIKGMRWPREAWPYLALIVCIVTLKLISAATHWEEHWRVQGAQVMWKPLASPGVALTLVVICLMLRTKQSHAVTMSESGLLRGLAARTKRPLLTIFFFLAMSQMMVKAGFLTGLVSMLTGLTPSAVMPLIAGFGALSGYMTGSNVGGNAIFMPAIALLPDSSRLLMAAVQNSAAGHAALGSLSIVMLVLGLAKTNPQEEGELVRFGFGLVCLNTAMVLLAALFLSTLVLD